MIIEAKIFPSLRHYLPNSKRHINGHKWDMPEGVTVAKALELLTLPKWEIKLLLVNGRHTDMDSVLSDSDILQVFPLLPGG
jgi:molybdopterin synthase sulfur carrier subunit